ncbi:FkbM family methyltransferase [Nodularia spumigena CS-591/12]|uniref:FkbM family methyltransferase n=1 Tax=Nodularia spumigena TaxID=70799 RepID=UPI00232D80AE|nr:FkbM family methyltransferase [Nodularia spumigena]MDB9303324.1 FkbM family methyltransferase [Nodularia spumigena CS-591/12]MDB9347609.1 FkbM family methyltransferase [Nodularia spumigena CS-588/01]MDB9353811.1 FkbM family methyltransferase [Nodularia spumigena CS-588/05]
MMSEFKRLVKSSIQSIGFDLQRLSPRGNPFFQLHKGLERFGVDLVFDIGANKGQFTTELRSIGYEGRIISFEPLPDAHQKLTRSAARDPQWDVHPQTAIGDFDGEIEINIAGNSVSSSVLPMLDAHSTAAVGSAYISKEKVPIARLDSIAGAYLCCSEKYFIKIDTQGFEWQVLDGSRKTLANAQGVQCEMSLVPLYEGQRLWLEMMERLNSEGFTLWSIQKGFTDPRDGRTLQIDAIFFRLSDH